MLGPFLLWQPLLLLVLRLALPGRGRVLQRLVLWRCGRWLPPLGHGLQPQELVVGPLGPLGLVNDFDPLALERFGAIVACRIVALALHRLV